MSAVQSMDGVQDGGLMYNVQKGIWVMFRMVDGRMMFWGWMAMFRWVEG